MGHSLGTAVGEVQLGRIDANAYDPRRRGRRLQLDGDEFLAGVAQPRHLPCLHETTANGLYEDTGFGRTSQIEAQPSACFLGFPESAFQVDGMGVVASHPGQG